ncbi:MAG: phosphonopyruvate decarboxylase [Betaproteobacteria bacterium]|nr:thiamine pyrophosphate-binding protein [Pseudomonadota bacterium]NBS57684.1 phosphonopyruvate decarboxylase [Betaproteobacteria bacterium]NBX91227.1 phosphonopyruvate decarboxylase [Betaproteobacteria bacterium]
MKKPTDWPLAIHKVLAGNGIRQVSYVPDAGHKRLIELCQADKAMRTVVLTTEEEGLGLVMGAWLAGDKSAVLMQSSGVGNIINTLATIKECRFPLLMLVTMRGDEGEFNPWQVPMGQATQTVLEAMGVVVKRITTAEDAEPVVSAAARLAYNSYAAVAVLIAQSLIGIKSFQDQTSR